MRLLFRLCERDENKKMTRKKAVNYRKNGETNYPDMMFYMCQGFGETDIYFGL